MSSGFISGGTTEQPAERNELWMKAEAELAAARKSKEEQKNHDGKSLYEVLQANKAAKQEAFEESMKLKNQFRSLDEDDVNFLNSIRDADKAHQQVVQEETEAQLESFRNQQQQSPVDSATRPKRSQDSPGKQSSEADEGKINWNATARKRKKPQDNKRLLGIKSNKLSSKGSPSETRRPNQPNEEEDDTASASDKKKQDPKVVVPSVLAAKKHKVGSIDFTHGNGSIFATAPAANMPVEEQVVSPKTDLGLSGYSSDET